METQFKRLFVGFHLPAVTCQRISQSIQRLQIGLSERSGKSNNAPLKISWVPQENYHLTLKFLGSVSVDLMPALTDHLGRILSPFSPFEVQAIDSGVFPNSRFPKIIWVGLRDIHNRIAGMAKALNDGLSEEPFSFHKEERPFIPHLTVARIKYGILPNHWKELISDEDWGTSVIREIILYESNTLASGSTYVKTGLYTLEDRQSFGHP
jgi:2'-5' RNA ligase